MTQHRQRAAVALAALISGIGFWLGEAGRPPWSALPIAVGIVGSMGVVLTLAGRRTMKASAGAAMIGVYALTLFCGLASFGHAFNECVERGEEVRTLLSEYRRSHSVYPETLNQLRSPIPCARISRPTLLTYERTTNGYTLSFHDWLVHHTASEDQSFLAHK
jgi:hypothetical protein